MLQIAQILLIPSIEVVQSVCALTHYFEFEFGIYATDAHSLGTNMHSVYSMD